MRRLWIAFTLVMGLSFLVLGWIGTRIHQEMPPIPSRVITTEGEVLVDEGEIQAGQNVWHHQIIRPQTKADQPRFRLNFPGRNTFAFGVVL